jgi:hypothetical protein
MIDTILIVKCLNRESLSNLCIHLRLDITIENAPTTTTTTAHFPTTTTLPVTSTTTTFFPAPCLIEKIYGEHSETTERIRFFRDTFLTHIPEGQEIIKLYYTWNVLLVKAIEHDTALKEEVKKTIDTIVPALIKYLE